MVGGRKARRDLFYGSLVGSGRYKPAVLFPEFYPDGDPEEEESSGGSDVEYDYSGVRWQSPGSAGLDEFTKMQEMMRDSGIAVIEDDTTEEEPLPVTTGEAEEEQSAEWV